MDEQTMPTLEELRGVIAHRKYVYDSHLMDMPVNWENIAAIVSGIADAQNEYIAALEADHAAQQQRIDALTKALEPFALMGDIFVNSATIHPSYAGRDREIYSLNDVVLTRGNFEDAYHLLRADEGGRGMSETLAVKRWYACQKCNLVDHYYELDDGMTTFPRGELLGHRDYLTTGFKSEAEARQWLDEHPLRAADDRRE